MNSYIKMSIKEFSIFKERANSLGQIFTFKLQGDNVIINCNSKFAEEEGWETIPRCKYSKEENEEMKELLRQGSGTQEVMKKFNVHSYSTIIRIKKLIKK
jgi:hypothetical protein